MCDAVVDEGGGGECMCTAVVDEGRAGGHTCGLDVVIEGRRQVGLCVLQWFKGRGRWVHVCCSG
jgi:hypothetical protein